MKTKTTMISKTAMMMKFSHYSSQSKLMEQSSMLVT